ncbi:MAG: M20/M25/M40 family metallo-hydrolase [Chloroflexi bacterium]|nr:M20/M25/M40 family metallo-hydrolase [Chloroflexota bacterium]
MSEVHTQLLEQIDRAEIVQLMMDLQRFRSFSGQEAEAVRFLAGWLEERGMEVELIDVADEPGRPDLVARLPGSGRGPSLMLNGHLDIDPVPLNYPGDPWACYEEDGLLYGHGLMNMKAGVAALASAAVAVKRAGVSLTGDLLVTGVVGELQGGVGAYDLVQRGVVADYTIVCEPSELEVRTIHSGAIQMLVHVTGESAWIGVLHREKYVNAIEKMTRVIDALKEVRFSVPLRDDLVGLPRMVVGGIMGGLGRDYGHGRPAYVPDFCTIILEVRGLPGQDWDQTREDIDVALRRLRSRDPELRYEIEMPPATYGPHWHSMKVPGHGIDVPTDHDFPQTVRRHHIEVLGAEPANVGFQNPGSYAWTDAGHFTRGGSLAIIYGPTTNLVRTVDIEKVMNCARVLALTATDICTRSK